MPESSTLPLEADFGQLLRRLRIAAHFTQVQLAEASDLSVDAIRKLESGARRAPYHETTCALAAALRLSDVERERFLAVAKRARAHGPVGLPSNGRPRSSLAPVLGIALGAATALTIILGLVAMAHFGGGDSVHHAAPGSRQPTIRITSAAQCTSQWSVDLTNNTAGAISILSGTQAFGDINSDRKEIVVEPGQTMDGKVMLVAHNGGAPFAIAPFIYTPSWGAPDKSWQLVEKWVPDGTTLYSPYLQVVAPSMRGIYYLIFAFQLEKTGGQVASGTNWRMGRDVWDDGNEIAQFSAEQIHEAQAYGCTTVRWLTQHGYDTLSVPADAITVNVR